MKRFSIFVVLALCAALLAAVPSARATAWDKLTYVTISGPVQVPGMTLQAGTYVFRLADNPGDRGIVQIWDRDRMHLYTTILAIADYRLKPTGHTVILFKEASAGEAPALKAWFYPGDYYGQEFVYPKSQAEALAQVNHEQVPSTPDETANSVVPEDQDKNTDNGAALTPSTPTQPTEDQSAVDETTSQTTNPPAEQTPQNPTTDQNQNDQNQNQNQDQNQNLPKTASEMPLAALCGLILIAGGVGLRIFAKRAA